MRGLCLTRYSCEATTGVLQAIFDGNERFTSGARQHDDMTLLALKCEAAG